MLAGTLAGIIGRILMQPPVDVTILILLSIATLILVLYGYGEISIWMHHLRLWRRKGNRILVPKVGILNDMGWDTKNSEISAWTNIGPEEWRTEILGQAREKKARIKVELTSVTKSFDTYAVVLNPYGGVYPERDLKNFETLSKIMNYVNEGGVFVNVADIPGYWAYSALLERRLDTTPPIFAGLSAPNGQVGFIYTRLFDLTPFIERLGLKIFNIEATNDLTKWNLEVAEQFDGVEGNSTELYVGRVVVQERNVVPILKPRPASARDSLVTPFFLVNYGEGQFVISLIFLSDKYPKNIAMKKAIVNVLLDRMNLIGQKKRIIAKKMQ